MNMAFSTPLLISKERLGKELYSGTLSYVSLNRFTRLLTLYYDVLSTLAKLTLRSRWIYAVMSNFE